MESYSGRILSRSEMSDEILSRVKSTYTRDAFLRDLIIFIISMGGTLLLVNIFLSMDFPVAMTMLLICTVTALFSGIGFITELFIMGMISRKDFTWVKGEIEKYSLQMRTRTMYFYAEIDNNFCNIWGNPIYSKGTEVYLLEFDLGFTMQKIMVKA